MYDARPHPLKMNHVVTAASAVQAKGEAQAQLFARDRFVAHDSGLTTQDYPSVTPS